MNSFFKFPSTPHLAVLENSNIRDDKVLSKEERELFLQHNVYVEEKIDGANLGISFDPSGNLCLQNRGSFLNYPFSGQWKKLDVWISPKIDSFFDLLTDRYILFGEWCYAKHSIMYTQLPDLFIGFDIYDKWKNVFWSVKQRNRLLEHLKIVSVPLLGEGIYTLYELTNFFKQSKFGSQYLEGIYLRIDEDDHLIKRAKLVRPDFVQTIDQHWIHNEIIQNKMIFTY